MSVTEAVLHEAIRERNKAIEERDRLREAAQAVVDIWLAGPGNRELFAFGAAMDALRAALELAP